MTKARNYLLLPRVRVDLDQIVLASISLFNNNNNNNNNIFIFTAQMQKGFQMRLTMKYLNYIYRKKINASKYNVKIQLTISITETIGRQWLNSVTAFQVINILLIIIFIINIVDLIVTSVHPHPSIHLSIRPAFLPGRHLSLYAFLITT